MQPRLQEGFGQPVVVDTNAAREIFGTEDVVGKKFAPSEKVWMQGSPRHARMLAEQRDELPA